MARVIKQMIREYPEANSFEKDELIGIYGEGLEESVMRDVEETAKANGFKNVWWVKTGCVIAAHSGPGAFGIVGFTK